MILDQPPAQWPGVCKRITGTIFGDPLEGRYCPSSGRIVFMRRTAAGTPTQLYQGFVGSSGRPLGGGQYANILRMSGTFTVWNAAGASSDAEGVDFNFTATR
jgi:hypothetical protein